MSLDGRAGYFDRHGVMFVAGQAVMASGQAGEVHGVHEDGVIVRTSNPTPEHDGLRTYLSDHQTHRVNDVEIVAKASTPTNGPSNPPSLSTVPLPIE